MLISLSSLVFVSTAKDVKKDEVLVCVRWAWTGNVFERKVYCLEWAKKDCTNRMYKSICRMEGEKL